MNAAFAAIVVLACAALLLACASAWLTQAERMLPTTTFGSVLVMGSAFGALVCLAVPPWLKIPIYLAIMLSARPRERARMPDAAIQAGGGILTLMGYAILGAIP